MLWNIIIFATLGIYAIFTLFLWYFWYKTPVFFPQKGATFTANSPQISVSIIIPVRNEASHITHLLADLALQNYPLHLWDVLIVNDNSTDNTVELIQKTQEDAKFNLQLLHLSPQEAQNSPKKQAIQKAIQVAKGQLIVTTDGDCRLPANWLETIAQFYAQTQAVLMSSCVVFDNEQNLFQHLQTIEFASLIGAGAATMQAGFPTMCNGANLAYLKSAFEQVNGFENINQIASGDDELLMRKITKKYPTKIFFLKSKQTLVRTEAKKTWAEFYQQRKRWASKWKHYPDKISPLIAFFIFFSNLAMLISSLLTCLGLQSFELWALQFCLKNLPELLYVGSILWFLDKKRHILLIPLLQMVYPLYVVIFGLIAQKSQQYVWKGRNLK